MNILLVPVYEEELPDFKKDMQEAFQKGTEQEFRSLDVTILPEEDIDRSLQEEGAAAYKAVADGKIVGGAIVVIDAATKHNHLDFLYVKHGVQNLGVGKAIWKGLERLYPDTVVWETCTPYFEKRNIHFYVNHCGFHIVEFFHQGHPDPYEKGAADRSGDEMFRLEKAMTQISEG